MKTKTSFRRAALPIISVLAAAIVSLTSVTFAWFTYGNEAKVEQITVDVEAAGGLQISSSADENAFKWESNVDLSELVAGNALTPVSASLNADKKLDFFTATYDDVKDKIYGITNQVGQNNGTDRRNYVSFDLYFRNMENNVKNVSLQVDVNNKTTVTSPTGQSNLATRIAFLTDNQAMPTSTLLTNQKPWATTAINNAVIFEPNAADHTNDGRTDYLLYNSGADANAKYDYKAPTVANSEDGVYFDRYTGDKYTFVKAENRVELDNENYYVADATAEKGFVKWEIGKDYIPMTASQANEYFNINSSEECYKLNDGVYEEYDYSAGFPEIEKEQGAPVEETFYYRLKKADVYKKETDTTTLKAVSTESNLENTYIELAAQAITKVTVYIWIEGQDADCTNSVAGYAFNVNLVFNAIKQA